MRTARALTRCWWFARRRCQGDQALTLMPPPLRLPSRSPSESVVTGAGTAGFVAIAGVALLATGALTGNECTGGMLETVMFTSEYFQVSVSTLPCKVVRDCVPLLTLHNDRAAAISAVRQ